MKAGTPASFAPLVSVFGMMMSAISVTMSVCEGAVRNFGLNAAALTAGSFAEQPCRMASAAGAEMAPPSIQAARRRSSRRCIISSLIGCPS